jgi:hypothetical protein
VVGTFEALPVGFLTADIRPYCYPMCYQGGVRLLTPGPTFDGQSYVCPACGAFAQQQWFTVSYNPSGGGRVAWERLRRVVCQVCFVEQIWYTERLLHPDVSPVPPPNPDLGDDVIGDYREAASILTRSPRGAAALLRLALQKLCVRLGKPGKNINDDIASLVADGLPITIQQALDVLRVVGNNAVHPGQIDLQDDPATASGLFGLLNLIADNRISEPRRIAEMFSALPETARIAIQERDG